MRVFDRDYEQPKEFLPGTRRSRSPADTLEDIGRHMTEVGITRLANVTGLDSIGIPVVQAIRPNSRSLSVSQGKGANVVSAKVSAMMEAIELWHAERIENPCACASYQAIRKQRCVVDVEQLPVVRGATIRPEEQRCWVRGWDLLQEEEVWVPFEFVSMNTVGVVQAQMTFLATSNGLASGNHLLEAIEHALCEVIERDAQALHSARGSTSSLPGKLDLDSITEPFIRSMIDACENADLGVAIFDMASDIGVPTFRAGLLEREGGAQWRRLGTEWGAGTHLSPVVAISRAITEAAQARLTVIAGSRDDNPPSAYGATQAMWSSDDDQYALFSAPADHSFSATSTLRETDTFEGDLTVMLGALRSIGIERVIVVDLTREDMGIPVVKVIVPELEAAPFVSGYVEGTRARRARQER
jgi:ribosomal protein S12 methylthiotransferase accessory factor